MANKTNTSLSDKAGIGSAILCTVHCLVIPVFFLIKFTWLQGNAAFNLPAWWEKLDYFFLFLSFLAVYHSASHTKAIQLRISLWGFWSLLAISIFFESNLHNLAYIASAGLITTHFINLKRMDTSAPIAANGRPQEGM